MRHTLRYLAGANRVVDSTPWRTELFPEQQAFFDDPSARKAALCSRRAGKTKVNAAGLLDALIANPRDIALYTTLTGKLSRQLLWTELSEANEKWNLGLIPSLSRSQFIHPTGGGAIWLGGCENLREAEKYRGPKYSRIILDEGGTYPTDVLTYFILNVLSPAATDLRAQIWLTGTPGVVPKGYFWGVTEGQDPEVKAWKTHRWTILQNPYHICGGNPAELNRFREEEFGLPADHPTWLREGLGVWALDNSKIIYNYDHARNSWDGVLPQGQVRTILGIDLGEASSTTFVVSSSVNGVVYVHEAFGRPGMLLDAIAATINHLKSLYPNLREVYADDGGLGGKLLRQMQVDYGVSAPKAQKRDKAATIMRAKTALDSGRIRINRDKCRPLLDEWAVLPWNEDHTNHDKNHFADHHADGFLYSFKEHSIRDPFDTGLKVYGPEDINQKVREEMMRAAMRKSQRHGRGW